MYTSLCPECRGKKVIDSHRGVSELHYEDCSKAPQAQEEPAPRRVLNEPESIEADLQRIKYRVSDWAKPICLDRAAFRRASRRR